MADEIAAGAEDGDLIEVHVIHAHFDPGLAGSDADAVDGLPGEAGIFPGDVPEGAEGVHLLSLIMQRAALMVLGEEIEELAVRARDFGGGIFIPAAERFQRGLPVLHHFRGAIRIGDLHPAILQLLHLGKTGRGGIGSRGAIRGQAGALVPTGADAPPEVGSDAPGRPLG